MGSKNPGFNAAEEAKKQSNVTSNTTVKKLEMLKKEVADGYFGAASFFESLIQMEGENQENKSKALASGGRDGAEQQQSHYLAIPKQHFQRADPHFGTVSPCFNITPCKNLGDVEAVREAVGVVSLKDSLGNEVRLDSGVLFAGLSEADRSQLLKVFAWRPDTFMRMGSPSSFVVRFYLESFSRMWGMLQNMNIGDCSEADLDSISKIFADMQLIKTDWIEDKLNNIRRLKKARLESIDRLKTIDAERKQATTEIVKLKILLFKAEKKKQKLEEEKARALDAPSEEDIAKESIASQWLIGG